MAELRGVLYSDGQPGLNAGGEKWPAPGATAVMPAMLSREATAMIETIRLLPHDAMPEHGAHAIAFRHFGEDNPNTVVTEILFHGTNPESLSATHKDGSPMGIEEAVAIAQHEAAKRGLKTLYVLDRTAGTLEQEVLAHHGDHSFAGDTLSDTDVEDGVSGSNLLDRPPNAGYLR